MGHKAIAVALNARGARGSIGAGGRATMRDAADRFAANIRPVINEIKANGAVTLYAIADELNARGRRTPRGCAWGPMSVYRVMRRCAARGAPIR